MPFPEPPALPSLAYVPTVFRAVVLYDQRRLAEEAVGRLHSTLSQCLRDLECRVCPWRLDIVADPHGLELVGDDLAEADLLLIALKSAPSPFALRRRLEELLYQLRRPGAGVALYSNPSELCLPGEWQFLFETADSAGVRVLFPPHRSHATASTLHRRAHAQTRVLDGILHQRSCDLFPEPRSAFN